MRGMQRYLLRRDAATSGKHVQRHPLAQEQMSRFAPDSSDMFDRLKSIAFLDMPFHSVRIMVNGNIGRLN
jgi:hypothetical protein